MLAIFGKFSLCRKNIKANVISYEYVLATIDENWQESEALKDAGVHHPHTLVFPASTGVFTLARTKIDVVAHGFTQDAVDILTALCEYMCISDVFISQEGVSSKGKLPLTALMKKLDRNQWADNIEAVQISNWHGTALIDLSLHKDHVSQALLIAAALQFPYLVPPSSWLASAAIEQKLKHLQYHIMQSSHGFYWKPVSGALLWCLVTGTLFSKGLPHHAFFATYMLRAAAGLCVDSIEGMRVTLATFYRQIRDRREMEKWISKKPTQECPP